MTGLHVNENFVLSREFVSMDGLMDGVKNKTHKGVTIKLHTITLLTKSPPLPDKAMIS